MSNQASLIQGVLFGGSKNRE